MQSNSLLPIGPSSSPDAPAEFKMDDKPKIAGQGRIQSPSRTQMRRRWALGVAMILFGVVGLFLPLQPPAPGPAKSGQDKENLGAPETSDRTDNDRPANSIQPATNDSHSQPKGREENNEGDGQNHDPSYGWLTMAASVVAAIATSIYAYFAARQWQAMRKQADYMRDGLALTEQAAIAATQSAHAAEMTAKQSAEQMHREQRAWLSIGRPTVTYFAVGAKPSCKAEIHNDGPTPGYITEFGFQFCAIDNDRTVIRDFVSNLPHGLESSMGNKLIIPPRGEVTFPFNNDYILDEWLRARIDDRTKLYILIVRFRYNDTLNQSHVTQAYFVYDVRTNGLSATGEHNEMT